jgi:hypothetical protein
MGSKVQSVLEDLWALSASDRAWFEHTAPRLFGIYIVTHGAFQIV